MTDLFATVQQGLFESLVQPLLYAAGLGHLLEDAFEATGWLLVGLLQIGVMLLLIAPLERWRPVEPPAADAAERAQQRKAVRVDVVYTLLHRLGAFRLLLFFTIDPLWDALFGTLSLHGHGGGQLDAVFAGWRPGLTDTALFAFAVYLVVFDFADYAIHRGQHGLQAWWALHALHHSQRRMTMWSDSRNHLLDDLLRDVLLVLLARAIGVPPAQFVAVVAVTQLLENLQHANLRLGFGRVGERLLASPRFHRLHHAIGVGHESHGQGSLGGCNFAVLFPVWDVIFGTANFDRRLEPTGIRDQLAPSSRDYGRGFWSQQWLGLKRLAGRG
ncbi:MAG TPA: sterol desaturase family protein [Methylibium sp.]|uniref:sterol desaturase family protein n=1 Tax=Methylibium sp. TaxID=2067992 RepID=UPI002DBDF6D1|nr:sterol desaturase family protein [Methylibium sp.]HEU4460300.1 sterol desaturase family protein [Methylibium sp.]